MFTNPYLADDGHTYDLKPIYDWLGMKEKSPVRNQYLTRSTLRKNNTMNELCEALQTSKIDASLIKEYGCSEYTMFIGKAQRRIKQHKIEQKKNRSKKQKINGNCKKAALKMLRQHVKYLKNNR